MGAARVFGKRLTYFRERVCLRGKYLDPKRMESLNKVFPFLEQNPKSRRYRAGRAGWMHNGDPRGAACALDVAFECAPGCTRPATLEVLCPPGWGLRGIRDRNPAARGGDGSEAEAGPPTRAPGFSKLAGLRRPAPGLDGGRVERPSKTREGKEKGAGLRPHQRARERQWPHSAAAPEQPAAAQRPPTRTARIFCFVVFFRSINKCVIVNVKTHQSNNNGTKSKDYPSLLVTAE